jgi:hypothetical protein
MHVSKRIDQTRLHRELDAAAVPVAGLIVVGADPNAPLEQDVLQPGPDGLPMELPPEARPVVDAHVAPPPLGAFADAAQVHAIVRTTDAVPLEVFRFPCEQRRMYEASMTIRGVDATSFACKRMVGEFVWKRVTGGAVVVGITVVSDIHDTATASWAPSCAASGADVVFTVTGAAGRTIDWLLTGPVGATPGGPVVDGERGLMRASRRR